MLGENKARNKNKGVGWYWRQDGQKMPLWYNDIWLELCWTEQVVHANVRGDHSRCMEQCMQRPWGRSALGFSGSLTRPVAGEEQRRVRGLVGPTQNLGFLHWVSWEPWGDLEQRRDTNWLNILKGSLWLQSEKQTQIDKKKGRETH